MSIEAQTSSYLTASCITVLVYDILVFFDQEVKCIWRSAWSIPKFLYIFSRYYPLFHLCVTVGFGSRSRISQIVIQWTPDPLLIRGLHSCRVYWWYHGFGGFLLIVPIVSMIFFLRVAALYGNNRKLNVGLLSLFLVEFTCELVTTIHVTVPDAMNAVSAASVSSSALRGCVTTVVNDTNLSTYQVLAWAPTLSNNALLFLLTLFKLGKPSQAQQKFGSLSPILVSLFKDGILYFFFTFIATVLLMLADLIPAFGTFSGYFHPWFILIYSISGSRLVLNLRRIALKENHVEVTRTDIVFNTFSARSNSGLDEGSQLETDIVSESHV